MATHESLSQRIKAEFDARDKRTAESSRSKVRREDEQKEKLANFNKVCDDLKSVWRPKLEEFAKQFGDQVKVTPKVSPEERQAMVEFLTDLASVSLNLTVSSDAEFKSLFLDYDLRIIPMFLEYDRHSRLEMPLNKIDRDAVGRWLDDRLVSCVKTYLGIQENEHYQQRALVEDPITKARFLRENAGAKLEHGGKTVYFSGPDSLQVYKQRQLIDQPPVPDAAAAECQVQTGSCGKLSDQKRPAVQPA